jgi:DNA-binding MarR family transcriptional regulator
MHAVQSPAAVARYGAAGRLLYDQRVKNAKSSSRHRHASADVRAALDAFRRIVQALRGDRGGSRRAILSSAQLFALQQIAEHPRASINDLAELTFTHQSSVSVVVQRLVSRRLVAKVPAREDRRRQCLALTPAGRQLLRRAPVAAQERLIEAIAALPAPQRRMLAKALGAVALEVAPPDAQRHPPMFFEETDRRTRQHSR